MLLRIPEHADAKFVENLLSQQADIESPCKPSHYRTLKRIATNPDNHLAIGLGAGSAPGLAGNLALAGILSELELHPYIKEVWGVSAGSIVGGVWCSGANVEQMLAMLEELDKKGAVDFASREVLTAGLLRMLRIKRFPEGLVRGENFRAAIEKSLKAQTFEDCQLPFRVIACTDDGHAQKVVFHQGPLLNAIMASICVPGVMFPVKDWNGGRHGYFDGAVLEKTPLTSIIEDHHREGRRQKLVVICTHFSDSGRIFKPVGFIQRMLNAMHRLEDQAWTFQAMKAREASNCKFLVLNPHMKEGGAFDFSTIRFNYLWARKKFKEQLTNAKLALRFEAE